MGARRCSRWIALLLAVVTTIGPLAARSAANGVDPIVLELGGGRIMSLTGVNDPLKTTGVPTGMEQQPGARFEPPRENCLLQPPAMDLRLIWMQATDDGYEVTLRFFAPFRFLDRLYDQPVKHTLALIFSPPAGDAITVTVGKNETVVIRRGGQKLDVDGVQFSLLSTDLVFDLPSALGIGQDWVLTTRSRIVGDNDFCPDPNFPNRYFVVTTTPVRVSSLTGEGESGAVSALPQGMAPKTVFHTGYKAIEWHPEPMPVGTRLESLHLERENGHLIAVLTMDGPFAFPTSSNGEPAVTTLSLGLDLAAPGYLGLNHPFSVRIELFGPGASPPQAVVSAPVSRSLGLAQAIGTVPVSLTGNEVRIDLSAMTPLTSSGSSAPLPSGDSYVAELGNTAFTIEGTLTFEQADGADETEPFTLDVVGPALRFTFADETTATGWIDPSTSQFIVDGRVVAGGLGTQAGELRCANISVIQQLVDESMKILDKLSQLDEDIEDAMRDPGATADELIALLEFRRQAQLEAERLLWHKPIHGVATGCENSNKASDLTIESVRALPASDDPLAKPN